MSIRVMSAVWDIEAIKGTEKLVLLALADFANDDGYSWPSLSTIAKKCGVSRRYAIDIMNKLEDAGYVQVTERKIDIDKNHTNLYKVVVNPASLVNPSSPPSEAGFTRVVRRGSPKPSFNHQLTVAVGGGDEPRPLIFELYETQIGALSPMIAEDLMQAEQDYPKDWIEAAFREAARNNARSWKYVATILGRWKDKGQIDIGKRNGKKEEPNGQDGTNQEFAELLLEANRKLADLPGGRRRP